MSQRITEVTAQATGTAAQRHPHDEPAIGLAALVASVILVCALMYPFGAQPVLTNFAPPAGPDGDWVTMPAGAKSTYIGIHGGTLPVSLLSAAGGTRLVTFVGRTGNDFLELLRKTDVRVPSLLNATRSDRTLDNVRLLGPRLEAGSTTHTLPVFCLAGENLATVKSASEMLPFGLSEKPLSIEGRVTAPEKVAAKPSYLLLVEPEWLRPKLR